MTQLFFTLTAAVAVVGASPVHDIDAQQPLGAKSDLIHEYDLPHQPNEFAISDD